MRGDGSLGSYHLYLNFGKGSKITVFFAATTVPQSGEDRKSLHKFQTPAENVVCAPNTGKANLGFKTGKIDPQATLALRSPVPQSAGLKELLESSRYYGVDFNIRAIAITAMATSHDITARQAMATQP